MGKCDVNLQNHAGATPLHYAALYDVGQGDFSLAKDHPISLLLEQGANVKASDAMGLTPLHLAACNNHVPAIKALLKEKAFVDSLF